MNYHEAVVELMKARPYLTVAEAKDLANELFSDGPKRMESGHWVFRFSHWGQPWLVTGDEPAIDALVARFKEMEVAP